jgi:hypothetical protein
MSITLVNVDIPSIILGVPKWASRWATGSIELCAYLPCREGGKAFKWGLPISRLRCTLNRLGRLSLLSLRIDMWIKGAKQKEQHNPQMGMPGLG